MTDNSITFSWAASSSKPEDKSGVATFTVLYSSEVQVSFSSFEDAHKIHVLLDKAYKLGQRKECREIRDSLEGILARRNMNRET